MDVKHSGEIVETMWKASWQNPRHPFRRIHATPLGGKGLGGFPELEEGRLVLCAQCSQMG